MSQNPEKTKILLVITQGELGGAQRYVLDLATHLNSPQSPLKLRGGEKGSYEILVAMGAEQPRLGQLLVKKGIKVEYLKYLVRNINPLHDLLAIWQLKKLIKAFQPDIIHLNSSKAGVLGSIAGGLAGNRNVIFTAHGFAFLEPHLFKFIYFWAERFATRFRRKIITVSEFDRQTAIKNRLCSPEKLITIHNGIDSKKIQISNIKFQPSSKITIGTIAHDYPTKDLATLRAAFAILKSEFNNLQLQIIGRGSEIGEVDDAAAELGKFDIYVCSSVKEGFPYSILEAMAAGLPIISTAVGGIPEAITDGTEGLLVPPKDPQALAAAIKKLILNPTLAEQLGAAAQKKVQEFSLDKMLSETVKVYQSL
ncbi:MAG: hypothetical protein A2846_01690 [Candidatus Doudnabacteria bacterium RIFCSPHIGHO2_01_FULL_49_9]|uniref:Glycosyltransferase subfamily 4-like N-terminal domain-containing protein n=1 Tax=Candidatus Doudnabacteria bacterium RIFCSPHIGHO2_01_FULL_49_9 TaxID=1817827 RepID=A0A1F5NZJ6_9BACT|nr:MAG: hypothetical protein A2846_01690 [Candidatus Doudnabacteria bacterium RIFCSPHIGHO2_01_FULL_49_9]